MTRTASQIAGYGGGAVPAKKSVEKSGIAAEDSKNSEEQDEVG